MITLNEVNGADKIVLKYAKRLMDEFDGHLYGAEMGIAYGGGVESIGKMWGKRGTVYGFDTFEDMHPKHLAEDPKSFQATCMDGWYASDKYNTDRLAYAYQRSELDRQGLDNVILVKGEVSKDSCKDIPYLNYVLLDMDIEASMRNGYEAVRDKVVPGGYLFLHDVLPPNHIREIHDWWYQEVMPGTKLWKVVGEWDGSFLAGFKRR